MRRIRLVDICLFVAVFVVMLAAAPAALANPQSQTITFTSTAPSAATVGGPTYAVTATGGGSGNPVTFSIDPSASSVCTISGATVSFTATETCVIDANQVGDGVTYADASQAQQSFSVYDAQTISFTSTAPSAATVGGASYTVTATGGGSGNPVTFSIDPSASSVCTISGATVSFSGAGTCVIDANQAGDGATYADAQQAQQSFTVSLQSQTITFTSTAPSAAKVGGATYTVTATGGGSGNAVTFTIDPTASGVCSISGATVSFTGAGTCVIDANQAGNGTYAAAPQAQQSFTVSLQSQTITFTSTAPSAAKVGGATYTVTATGGGSGNAVTFTIDPSASGVCTISGATVSFTGAGTCVIDANQAGNGTYAAAPQAQQSFGVHATQTITFTSTAPTAAKVGGATYTVTATGGGSGNAVTFTIDASASSVCSISGATVSFIGTGTCVIDANQAGNGTYAAATQAQQSFAVSLQSQTITFTSTAPTAAKVGGATYTVTATGGGSGNAVTFSIDPSASSVCTISGATVSFIGAGTCVIDANQAGNGTYAAAPQAQQSFAVSLQSQTITFTSTAPTAAKVGGATYTVTATGGGSGNAVTFSIDPSASSVCTISGATVSFIGAGTCVIDANQAGNSTYAAAAQAQQSFAVSLQSQTITFTSTAPTAAKVGGATYTVTATGGGSGNAVTFSIDPSASSVCTISGATVSFIGAGTCVIDANQAGNSTYAAAPQAQQSFGVLATQTITFTSTTPSAAKVGGATYTVTASGGGSGNAVTFSIDPSAGGVCTISGATVSFIGAGACVVDANQAGNSTYAAAAQAQQSFAVSLQSQTITFTSTAPSAAKVGGATYTVTATGGGSGNAVTFTIDPSASGVCTISGATVSFVATGTCVIDANQAGNSTYAAATQAQQSFSVGTLQSQTITFTSTAPSAAKVGGATYTVAATGGGSGNAVTFTIDPSASGVCTISGATVSFIGAGTCVIDANQAGNSTYAAAAQAQQSFTVSLQSQAISFTSTAPTAAKVGGATYTVTATGGLSGNPVTFTIDPSASSVCTISGAVVSFIGSGTCVVDANQAGNSTYAAAAQAQQSFVVHATQTITFTSTAPTAAKVGGATYTVTATGGLSGNPVTFTIDPSASGVCTISGATVSFIGTGTCVIDANQAGNSTYAAATQAQQSFSVGTLQSQTITFTSTAPTAAKVGGATYTVTATGGLSGNPVTFTIDPSASAVCTISAGVVSFIGAGTCVVDANQSGNSTYAAATQAQQSFTVSLQSQTISFTSTAPTAAKVGGATYMVTATGGLSGNPVTFTIDPSASAVCTISAGVVSFIGAGTCVIDANQAGNGTYAAATQAQQSFVVHATQTITFTSTAPAAATVGGATYTVTATGGLSGNPVTFTIDPSASAVCTISGATVSFIGTGTCVIDANQAGNSSYAAATQAQQSFAVGTLQPQTISFTSTAPTAAKVGGASYTVTATGGLSGNPVTFTIDPSASAVCTISAGVVSFIGAGTCVIDANQAGNSTYAAATQAQQSFTVSLQSQTISFTSTAPTAAKVGGATYTVTATGGLSGNPVTFTIDPSASAVCTISGATVSFIGAGTCVIDANQAGNGTYAAATQAQQSFTVSLQSQVISFTSTAPTAAVVGGGTYTVTATGGGSGNAVTFSIDPSATSVCTISAGVVSFIGAGTCMIDANQAGNSIYASAAQAQQSFSVGTPPSQTSTPPSQTITLQAQAITFRSTPPTGAKVGGATYKVSASGGGSGNPVTFTVDSSAKSVCRIAGSVVSFIGAGTCVIDANQAGNSIYAAASRAQQTIKTTKNTTTTAKKPTPKTLPKLLSLSDAFQSEIQVATTLERLGGRLRTPVGNSYEITVVVQPKTFSKPIQVEINDPSVSKLTGVLAGLGDSTRYEVVTGFAVLIANASGKQITGRFAKPITISIDGAHLGVPGEKVWSLISPTSADALHVTKTRAGLTLSATRGSYIIVANELPSFAHET